MRAADARYASGIEQSSIAIASEEIGALPRIRHLGIAFVDAEVELAGNAILPRHPWHHAIRHSGVVNHVARPTREVRASFNVASMAAAGLIPPQRAALL